jgi:hypothetical protein
MSVIEITDLGYVWLTKAVANEPVKRRKLGR